MHRYCFFLLLCLTIIVYLYFLRKSSVSHFAATVFLLWKFLAILWKFRPTLRILHRCTCTLVLPSRPGPSRPNPSSCWRRRFHMLEELLLLPESQLWPA